MLRAMGRKIRGRQKNRGEDGDGESTTAASSVAASEGSEEASSSSSSSGTVEPERWANEPTTWAEPLDDDEDGTDETLQGGGLAGLDDALLGRLDASSAETRRLQAALAKFRNESDGRGGREVNVIDKSFDARIYLSHVHKGTSLPRLMEGASRIREEMEEGKAVRQAKQLVRFNLARFVATQDRMLDLHHKLSEGDDESAKGSISQLRATLDAVSHMCQRIYEPMIERHEKSSQIHAALTLLNRHNEALSLPSKIKTALAVGSYDRVVLGYTEGVSTLRHLPHETLRDVVLQVESLVNQAKEQLQARLRDSEAPVMEMSKAIQYLSKLEALQREATWAPPDLARKGRAGGFARGGGGTVAEGGCIVEQEEGGAGAYCMKWQREAVLLLMHRCHSSFIDQVDDMGKHAQFERDGAEDVGEGGGERKKGKKSDEQGGVHQKLAQTYQSLALTLCSSLTSILLWHTQRLITLDEAMRAQCLRGKDGASNVAGALGDLIETYGLLLRPIFAQERQIGGVVIKPSLDFQLSALMVLHQGRVELRGKNCPEELLMDLASVISNISRDAVHHVMRQVHERIELLTRQHAQVAPMRVKSEEMTGNRRMKRDIETGTSQLPMQFRSALTQAVHKVKGLVTFCDDVGSEIIICCFAAFDHFLDCLHALSLGGSGDRENEFLHFWEGRSVASRSNVPNTPGEAGISAQAQAGGLVERTGLGEGDGGSDLLLMALSDCVWVRKNCESLVQECALVLTRDKSELSDLVSSTDMDDLIRLCTSLEDMITEKYVRGCTLALTRIARLGLVQREESLTRNETGDRYVPDGVREWVIRALMMLVTIHESLRCIGEDVRDRILSKVVEKLWWTCVDFVSNVGSVVRSCGSQSRPTSQARSLAIQIDSEMDFLRTALKRFENQSIKILLRDLGNDLQVLLVSCNVNVEDAEAARKLVSRDALFRSRILADCLA